MSWFEEQIRQRRVNDQEIFEDAVFEMASAVLGRNRAGRLNDERIVTQAAIDQVLKYYHFRPVEIPDRLKDEEERLEYALRTYGLMHRNVTLSGSWYREAYGPMMVRRKDDGLPVVLLPRMFGGYYWKEGSGPSVKVTKKTMKQFGEEAICFYKPLPLREIGIADLISYMKDCIDFSDWVVMILLTLMVTLTGMVIPQMTRFLTSFVIESGKTRILYYTAVLMISSLVAGQLFSLSRALMMNRIQLKTALSVEAAMMMRLMSMPVSFFKKFSSGELASRSGAINELCQLLLGNVLSLCLTAVVSLLYIRQIYVHAPSLVLPSLLIVAVTVLITYGTGHRYSQWARRQEMLVAKEAGVSYSLISNVKKIRLSGAEKRAFAKWAAAYKKSAELQYNPPLYFRLNPVINTAVSLGGTLLLYYLAARSSVTPSAFLAFSAAYGAMTGSFTALSDIAVTSARIRPILKMAEPILKEKPEVEQNRAIVTGISGNIEFSGVSFRYDEHMPYVIDNMDLKISQGEYLAVVGTTGCGKSTLIRLLLGFEIPEKGTIYYDNKDMHSLDLRSLRRRMGVVLQDGSLMHGDIFSNIAVSSPKLTVEEAWEAAELAGVADDIRAMPMGMNTIIAEGQGGISGGQKQRLLIARAIAPKPDLLLFDEATSALDNRTQKMVSNSLNSLNCTRIVVAHRLSTIKDCDRILVMDRGKIVEQGSYDSLLEKNGFFAKLVERQRIEAL
ncbi:MAG: ATP-binding cassette domain-containing protein [Firmicutes bacterium]|nr:ATP-binding cassette domain-containing protein [Bacillota bacterium]